jgi:glycosyltransferase involved in cell wall biosynthesis
MKELRKYILYVGNDYPHKNLDRLKSAFKKLNLDYELILVTEFVSDKELDKLYKNASLYIQPSLCEGFGLPPLEAMARGVPVACSNTACLPEVLGEAAIYFDPLDINDIAEKMRSILLNEGTKKALIKKGFEQVKKYSWDKMAKQTLELYKNILR